MSTIETVTFGEAMTMFIADKEGPLADVQSFSKALAGAETNVAIGLARLGFKSGWASKVGNDSFGAYIMAQLAAEKVDVRSVAKDPRYPTGFQLKSKVTEGDPAVEYYRKGSAASHMDENDFDPDYFGEASHLHMTGIPLALSESTRRFAERALHFMKAAGKTVSFDPNLRPSLWKSEGEMIQATNSIAAKADYLFPGIQEGEILTGYHKAEDIAEFYLNQGVKTIAVKLGKEGVYYRTKDEEGTVGGIPVKEVVDTVGAGDGFAAGMISGILEDLPLKEAVMRGNAIGALAVQSKGDSEGYPDRKQLDGYLEQIIKGV
ncbi:sugar kinase [Metabacillus sp. GX 13764]|uniref:sugar kinase n=1 Tax=Metabacillus kandeliae TaxID=2900151 RepID=UPI001E595905|nr:sugar kinase [Metabacillus kandeliae]MCD7036542.1 sugar kinase [Metabacillus kandeliae]